MSTTRTTVRFLLACFLIVLTGCGGGGGGGGAALPVIAAPAPSAPEKAPVVEAAGSKCSVVLYGDSIMAGNGTAETPPLTLAALRPKLTVESRAVPGTRLSTLAETYFNEPRTARIVVIENGNIDSWAGANVVEFKARLRSMVEFTRQEGRLVVLTGLSRVWPKAGGTNDINLRSMSSRDEYAAAVADLAREQGIQYAGWNEEPFHPDELLDDVHPGKAYSDRLVALLALAIDRTDARCAP